MTQSTARRRRVALTGLPGMAALALCALLPALAAGQEAPLPVTGSFTLPNGLRVVHAPDPGTPLVALSLWYPTGGATEGPGQEGFALLMQRLHLMGEEPGKVDALGGAEYAAVDAGWTAWDVVVPAERLREGLARQARRLGRWGLSDEEVREAIREVWGGSLSGDAAGMPPLLRIREALHGLLPGDEAGRAPFSFPRGSPPEVEDVQAFRDRYYGPESAVLVVTGDVAEEDLLALAEEILAPVSGRVGAATGTPATVARRTETQAGAARRGGMAMGRDTALVDARLDRALVEVAYAAPGDPGEEMAVDVLVRLLAERGVGSGPGGAVAAGGEPGALQSSRIQVRRMPYRELDVVVLTGVGEPGMDPGEVEAELLALAEDALVRGFSPGEVREAWRGLALDRAVAAATVRGRAELVREGMLLHGDPNRILMSALRPEAVTPGSVAAAARRLLVPEHRFVVRAAPAAGGAG